MGITFLILNPAYYGDPVLWKRNANLYWTQFVYGIMSFPFLIFAVPMCQSILTKARPTAYDRDGRCVPLYIASEDYVKKYGHKINSDIVGSNQREDQPMIEVEGLEYVLN